MTEKIRQPIQRIEPGVYAIDDETLREITDAVTRFAVIKNSYTAWGASKLIAIGDELKALSGENGK